MSNELNIMSAISGGFIVSGSRGELSTPKVLLSDSLNRPLFAGTLSQCLSFMNDYFTPGDKDAPKDR
jgi:hypothetical protein